MKWASWEAHAFCSELFQATGKCGLETEERHVTRVHLASFRKAVKAFLSKAKLF